ncbi:hypothetical protein [Cellvibrio mixtus]|uniref:hypothetical protein n=1 Tax=Cellvibrio mixtus TaxID=39650 RepID=UPI0006942C90|nr:hypothetical protein [Cellvibrio mixtus]
MTRELDLQPLLSKLVVPAQNLAQLSFCGGNKEPQVKQWLQQLPLTQAQQVSAPLYTAVHELSRLQTSWENRLLLLELLRIPVHQTLNGLALKYLNQPLILPEAALKTATVAQAIQKHFLNGYLTVVRDLCIKARKTPENTEYPIELPLAIQRALTALGLLLLRSYQLYLPISSQIWSEIHALYRLTCALGVEHLPVEENLPHHRGLKNIQQLYLRILLLATARPNQLRQDEIENTYKLLDLLAPYAELETYTPAGKENLFVVLLDSNRPPFYKSNWRTPHESGTTLHLMELRTTQLVQQLQDVTKASTDTGHSHSPTGFNLTAALTRHLEQAWSHLAMRSFERQDVNTDIEVTVGLTNIHFHIAGEQPFNLFLNQSSALSSAPEKGAIYQKRGVQLKIDDGKKADDPWGDTFDIKGTILDGKALPTLNIEKQLKSQERENYQGNHPVYTVPLIDRSLGGYGLEWRDEIPAQVRAGELLGLREYGRTKWAIGVVRWAHQTKGATQLGIQILAPHALPVGLAAVHKTGGFAEYLRALQIPELKAINQPPSLIANAISFHEYSKARLYLQPQAGVSTDDLSVQLTNRLFATGAFSQFGYRELVTAKPAEEKKDDFDSVWQ